MLGVQRIYLQQTSANPLQFYLNGGIHIRNVVRLEMSGIPEKRTPCLVFALVTSDDLTWSIL
jgi:hypothetical protein